MGQGDALEQNKNINPRPSQGVVAIDRICRKNIGRSRDGAPKRVPEAFEAIVKGCGCAAIVDCVGPYCANAMRPA